MENMKKFVSTYDVLDKEITNSHLMMSIHPDVSVRTGNAETKQKLETEKINLFSNEEYEKVKWDLLSAKKLMTEFKNNGCGLSRASQQQVAQINKDLKDLESQFTRNLSEMVYKIQLTKDQSETLGVPVGDDGMTTMSPGVYEKIMVSCGDDKLRRTAAEIKETVIENNVVVLKSIYELRQQKASLLGYESVSKMVHSDASIKDCRAFLTSLIDDIRPMVQSDMEKKSKVLGIPVSELRKYHNRKYYNALYTSKTVDASVSESMFDTQLVIQTFRDIYRDLLRLSDLEYSEEELWIKLPCLKTDGRKIYFDMSSRDGKFPHPSEWGYYENGQQNACIVCSIGDKISYDVLVKLFHELGHGFNTVLDRTEHNNVGGTNVCRDIVEVPGIYFESYMAKPEVIQRFGVDEGIAAKLSASQKVLKAEAALINACMALVDIELNDGLISVEGVPQRLEELSGFEFTVGNFVTRWIHQVGYECQYYSYVYAQCWAPQLNEDLILEYLQYSSAENLERMFGPLDTQVFVKSII
jgi:Zn-dependent oligopeptidase